jgi:hypothetical protein
MRLGSRRQHRACQLDAAHADIASGRNAETDFESAKHLRDAELNDIRELLLGDLFGQVFVDVFDDANGLPGRKAAARLRFQGGQQ